jgi:hypothetical protein
MGTTIAYRGQLADLTRIEDFEDRVLDFALEVGGMAQIWRSHADQDLQRVVRGVLLNLMPGQETTSLLISPEGWLIGLLDIQDAENGKLTEAPWCFVKTQYGPVEGHVALVEMFTALRDEFLPGLEVSDEGGYWETRDLAELSRRHAFLQQAIEGIAEGLRRHQLSPEAAEDPDIVVKRIERIAALVHRILRRPAEHPPVSFPEDEAPGTPPDPDVAEATWDEMFKHNRRQQERLQRALEERRSRGEEDDDAFEKALGDIGLGDDDEDVDAEGDPWPEGDELAGGLAEEEFGIEEGAGGEENSGGTPFDPDKREGHPLLEASMDLLHRLHKVFGKVDRQYESGLRTLFQGAGDAMGGLAQALGGRIEDLDDYGLRLTQLKRALRGAAFARGALFSLREAATVEQVQELRGTLKQLEQDIFREMGRVRAEGAEEE